ncbi:DExH-box splicing factor binding site-domain-containing protein [Halenospora varia]|nr:DExH-box splicing factor binding site-domain-containing protein [Halenospora varia]
MSPSKDDSAPPKIAIKGFSLSSKSSSSASSKPSQKPKPPPPSTLGKRSRGGFGHDDSDSDHESHSRHNGRHETVTGFAEGGAIKVNEEKKKEELVIASLGNRDWRGEMRAKKGKNLLPPEVQKEREAARQSANGEGVGKKEGVDVVNSNDGEISWGLSVRKRVKVEDVVEGGEMDVEKVEVLKEEEEKKQTADEEALEALLGQRQEKKGPDLVISQTSQSETLPPVSEQDAYKRAIALAPDVSTLEDYERVPVEEFGAALLRGMGWKGEKVKGAKEVKRRQNLLGLGAKELKDAEELGAWVQRSDVKRLKPAGSGGRSGGRGGERRPRVHEYNRERERRDERRSEGSYRREREREREYESKDRHRR